MRQLWVVLVLASAVVADALVTVDAMNASTIAELFVDAAGVRVELEIGVRDLQAFGHLLPEDTRASLELPLRGWSISADGSRLQPGKPSYQARRRKGRDPITGAALVETDEKIVAITLRYSWSERPQRLTLQSPSGASVGFVLYHEGVAVNDFRYLPAEATVELDWGDPWFSRFGHRNLRRRYDAPVSAFLYVEPYEIRKEIVLRPRDLERWLDLDTRGTISVEQQPALKAAVARFLAGRSPVVVDGKPAEFTLDRIHFVRRTLRRVGVVDPPEEMNAASATLGVIFVHPRDGTLPKKVSMNWDLFPERFEYVPAVAADEAGGLPTRLTPDEPDLVWDNFLTNPAATGFVQIDGPSASRAFPWITLALAAVALLFFVRRRFVVGVLLLVGAGVAWPRPTSTDPDPALVGDLLRNVYRAFDFRGEETIYDALSRSISGPVLQEAYLDIRRSLELRNQGGARVKVKEVNLVYCKQKGAGADCLWEVTGTVGHWGHIHTRVNRYEANLEIHAVDGEWKITRLDVRDEQRLR